VSVHGTRDARVWGLTTLALIVTGVLAPASARADGNDPCLTAPVEGQKLRNAGKLVDARGRFAVCARSSCPAPIVQSCVRWGTDVQGAIPSAVVAVRDPQGQDLGDVRVSIDGAAAVELSPRALELDPGPHRFVFQRSGNADVRQDVVLREGEKNRPVTAIFGALPATDVPPPPASAGRAPLLTWVFGGLGIVAFASFATSGALGVAERSTDHCASGCTQIQSDDINSKFVVADISLGVGVVALGLAAVLYFTRPTSDRQAAGLLGARF
jgi:hypothetical protein